MRELESRDQGEGSRDQRPGVRARGRAARRRGQAPSEKHRDAAHRLARRRRQADGRSVTDEDIAAGRRDVDRHPGHAHRPGGVRAPAADGGRAARAGHRPGRGDRHDRQGGPPRPRRAQGSQAPDRLVHLPRPHRRRQDRAGQGAGRVHVRLRGRADQDRHVRVHGAPQRVAAWSARLRATSATKRAAS